MRKIEEQVRGVLQLLEEGKSKEVVAQLTEIHHAFDVAIAHIVAKNLHQCIQSELASETPDTGKTIKKAIELLVKSR